MGNFLHWVYLTPFSQMLQNHFWMVPTIQAVHIACVALVFVSAVVLDLRLLGVMNRSQSMPVLTRRFAPWVGWGVLVLLCTGLLLMIAEPTRAILNPYFQIKMAALVIVGCLTWWLAVSVQRHPDSWAEPALRGSSKPIAFLSLALWAVIVIAGRWIAYGP